MRNKVFAYNRLSVILKINWMLRSIAGKHLHSYNKIYYYNFSSNQNIKQEIDNILNKKADIIER